MNSIQNEDQITQAINDEDLKGDIIKDDGANINVLVGSQDQGANTTGVQVIEHEESAFVGMSRWQAMKVFWKPTLYCYMCAFSVVMNGYQDSVCLIPIVISHIV